MHRPRLYSRYSAMQRADAAAVLRDHLHRVALGDGAALDVGAGDGRTTVDLLLPALRACRLVGADASPAMVEHAARRAPPGVDFVELDVEADAVPVEFEGSFDHVFSFYCLHWVRKLRVAFKNIHDMLKPGGDILVAFLATHPIYELFERISQNIRWTKHCKTLPIPPYYKCKDRKEYLEKILEEVGFCEYECMIEDKTFEFDNCDVLERSIAAVDPIRDQLPSDELKRYTQDILEEIRSLKNVRFEPCINNNEEKVVVEYKLFVVYAKKSSLKSI